MSDTLILVHVLARHGDRCTDKAAVYPNDPHKSHKYHPYGHGMLTTLGKKNMYNLGKKFRERYNDYLGDLYLPEYVDSWTTQYVRTRTSAQLFLTGLFPPNEELKWNEDLNWQPIHTNYLPIEDDDFLGAMIKYEKFITAYHKVYETDYGRSMLKDYEDVISYVREYSGLKNVYLRQLAILYDCFRTEVEFGLSLPEWTKEVFPNKLLNSFKDEMRIQTSTKELRRYVSGKLFKKILTDTQKKINNESQCKFNLYLAHDVNVIHALINLGLWDNHLPKYNATITFEVHRIDNRYGIKVFYKKDVDADFELMTFKNGKDILWMEDLEEIVNDLWSDDNNKCEGVSNSRL